MCLPARTQPHCCGCFAKASACSRDVTLAGAPLCRGDLLLTPLPRPFPDPDDGIAAGVAGLVLRLLEPPSQPAARIARERGISGQFCLELPAEFRIVRHHA